MSSSHWSRFVTMLRMLPTLLLTSTPPNPDGTDEDDITPAGAYLSPSWGWQLQFHPGRWQKIRESTDDDIDLLVLASREPTTASTRVSFHSSPRGSDTIRAHLEEAAAALAETIPGAVVTPAKDANGYQIFQRSGDHHWIGSYIISDLPGGADDIIVELDSIAIRGYDGVLVVKASTIPTGYDLIFPQVEALRTGMSENGQMLIEPGETQTSGGRPKVLY